MYKCFVSYSRCQKRYWKTWRSKTLQSALSRIDLIAQDSFISYVRLEREP